VHATRLAELLSAIFAVVMAGAMIAAVPWLISRLPEDYFVRPRPPVSLPVKITRNVLGVVLILVGIALLILPGQGVLTIVLGLSLLDVKAKHRAIQWILGRPKIWSGLQGLRAKLGRPPLLLPSGP
jgi:hypothetical protein